jgi:1D-myo-inositol 3-kinase
LKDRNPPDFVVIGHVCRDILPDGSLGLGGSVSYATTTALRMGCRVGVVTSVGPGLDLTEVFPEAQIACHQSPSTTVFENIYREDGRRQILHRRADVITCDQIPKAWRSPTIVYLGSIDREISTEVFHCFADETLVGVMPQGFFRSWDEEGNISYAAWTPSEELLRSVNVLVISELDVPDPARLVRDWQELVEIIVVTHAERGATVYYSGESCTYPARPAREVDPTGAGDVFTAAFLISLSETGDPCQAAAFANAAASFSVEGDGLNAIPLRHQVDAYLKASG